MCQGRWFCEGNVADLEETKRCTGSGSADFDAADGSEEYSMKMLVRVFWWSADESGRRKEARTLQEFWWFSCRFLDSLFLESLYFLVKQCVCRNRLGLVSIRLYISVVRDRRKSIHIQYNNHLQFSCTLLFLSATSLFSFSASSFKLIKDISHSSDLICWWVFVLPSKSEF